MKPFNNVDIAGFMAADKAAKNMEALAAFEDSFKSKVVKKPIETSTFTDVIENVKQKVIEKAVKLADAEFAANMLLSQEDLDAIKAKNKKKADKAVRLAVLLLGDKVPDSEIEAQSRIFMKMELTDLEETIKRFYDTEKVYSSKTSSEEPGKPVVSSIGRMLDI